MQKSPEPLRGTGPFRLHCGLHEETFLPLLQFHVVAVEDFLVGGG